MEAGAPKAGVHVYFLGADSSVVATVDTGADGAASAVMAAGGSVTALDAFPLGDPGAHGLFTYLGVQPGDHLSLARSDRGSASFTLTAPSVASATNYDVFTTCGNDTIAPDLAGGPSASGVVELEGCHGGADIAILARHVDSGTQVSTPLSGLFHAGAVLSGAAPVNLTDAYVAPTDMHFTYMNVPTGAQLDVQHAPLLAHGPLGPFEPTVQGGTGTLTEPTVPAASAAVLTSLDDTLDTLEVLEWGPSSADYTLDLSGAPLPEILGRPAYDFATARVTWSEAAQGATPDATITVIEATRSAASQEWAWFVVGPHTTGEITLPRLPTDVASWTPVAGDTAFIDHVSNVKLTGGYDALRARTIDVSSTDLALVAGSSGRFVSIISMSSASSIRPGALPPSRRPARRSVFGRSRSLQH
jgi:hypothetical protein